MSVLTEEENTVPVSEGPESSLIIQARSDFVNPPSALHRQPPPFQRLAIVISSVSTSINSPGLHQITSIRRHGIFKTQTKFIRLKSHL